MAVSLKSLIQTAPGRKRWIESISVHFSVTNPRNMELQAQGLGDDKALIQLIEISEREAVLELPDTFCRFGELLLFKMNTENLKENLFVELKAKIIKQNIETQAMKACTTLIQFEVGSKTLIEILDLFKKSQASVDQLFSRMKG